MGETDFDRSVFVNCPFDEAYAPLLQAMLFCIVDMGFRPRIASERSDSGEIRVLKIVELISASRYSIHDLSRAQSSGPHELFRLNMPFELGIDYGCRLFGNSRCTEKRILVLEEQQYRYQATLSDISGCDIAVHSNDYQKIIRQVRNFLRQDRSAHADGASRIAARYADFQGWHYDRQLSRGFSEDDIRDYPTAELLQAMQDWRLAGRPAFWRPVQTTPAPIRP